MQLLQVSRILRATAPADDTLKYHVYFSAYQRSVKVCLQPRPESSGVGRAWFDVLAEQMPRDWRVEVVAALGDPVTRTLSYLRLAAPAVEDDGNPPNGCRMCGIEQRDHCSRYKTGTGWHYWVDPGDALRKARMLARRGRATATA
ncbi:hypothetical protein ACFOY2_46175 [Nonomuraea purpurea]|uniref:Uncharacterized protein n=1 Tax=Nonomuraea purpurea TaxID=1849276 RepID=A0ABV8GPA4_9ACTN